MTFTCDAARGDANPFIERNFYDCVYTVQDLIGFVLGMISILLWLVAQIPQLISNIQNQSSEALSVWFLTQWFLGDTLNLLGCLISGTQLATTTYLAMYFVVSDVVMLTQFIYYGALKARREKLHQRALTLKKQHHHHHHHHRRHHSHRLKLDFDSESYPVAASLFGLDHGAASDPLVSPIDYDDLHDELSQELLFADNTLHDDDGVAVGGGSSGGGGTWLGGPAAAVVAYPMVVTSVVISTAALSAAVLLCAQGRWGHVDPSSSSSSFSSAAAGGFAGGTAGETAGGGMSSSWGASHGERLDDSFNGFWTPGEASSSGAAAAGGPLAALSAVQLMGGHNQHWVVLAGTAIGYCSSCLYIVSRVSQILKNHSRQSAEGLSIAMFAMAFCGNLCTGTSILLRAVGWPSLMQQLPWVCGTFGTTLLDGFIFHQAFKYGALTRKGGGRDRDAADTGHYSRLADLEQPHTAETPAQPS